MFLQAIRALILAIRSYETDSDEKYYHPLTQIPFSYSNEGFITFK